MVPPSSNSRHSRDTPGASRYSCEEELLDVLDVKVATNECNLSNKC